ncbi:SDR family NAD(P)-dependent oxidoreductase [Peribacillus frigoritolerans]|uniref:SDR family NAD(P)-dependent oxidoreductase n=1 Tax=Peribacillus frigoritolerans TaxID=450367 RepID=UPI00345C801F
MSLKGKVIIITGAGSGIGKETAYKLADQGAIVVAADYNDVAAKVTAESIQQKGGTSSFVKVDVAKAEEVEAMVEAAIANHGTINGIFNNAGIGLVKPFLEMDPESYHRVVDVDQHGVYYGMYYAARKMVELGVTGATIVNTASIYGTMVSIGSFNYHAAKAAVIAMTKSGAIELAQYGIRVVGVAPGFIETPIIGEDPEFLDSLAQLHMRKKLIQPEKVAEVVTFLFSEKADAINGQVIPVDDGFLSFKG